MRPTFGLHACLWTIQGSRAWSFLMGQLWQVSASEWGAGGLQLSRGPMPETSPPPLGNTCELNSCSRHSFYYRHPNLIAVLFLHSFVYCVYH